MHHFIIPGIKRSTLTEEQLQQLGSSKRLTLEDILQLTCQFFHVSIKDAQSKHRKTEMVEARQVYCYIAKLYTKASLKDIAGLIGGRDHTTAIHSIQTVRNHLQVEPDFKRNVDLLITILEKKLYGSTIKTEAVIER